jgi:predicted nucleotidyltransferase
MNNKQTKLLKQTDVGLIPEDWEVVRHLKEALCSLGIDTYQIILFGSRARGESTEKSDYDFLIVVDEAIDFQEKRKIIRLIRRKMAEHLSPVDVFIKSKADFKRYRKVVGSVAYSASKEGMTL